MKAIVCTAYGGPDVLKLEEVEKPRPKAGEVLVRVHATTASRADCEIRRFEFPAWVWLPVRLAFGVFKPRVRILGQEFAGEVEALGDGATSFAPGDRVYGTTGIGLGAYAEYVRVGGRRAGSVVAPMPAAMSYAEAAAVPYGAMEALRFLRKAGIGAGQRVLIIGAGGSFGTYAVQLAKHAGAEVVAVDSAGKLEMLREIGADQVIDYTEGDFTDGAGDFDIVFDVVGRAPFGRVVRLLRPGGRYVVANAAHGPVHPRALDVADRRQEDDLQLGHRHGRAPARRHGARRGRRAPAGHRPPVPPRADGRGPPVRRHGAEAGQHRDRRRLRQGLRARLVVDAPAKNERRGGARAGDGASAQPARLPVLNEHSALERTRAGASIHPVRPASLGVSVPVRRSRMVRESRSYSKAEVLAGGFEASCELICGTRYLWHGTEGIRVDAAGGTRWVDDPEVLPEGDWYPTELGEEEIAVRTRDS